jgi:hypothetical protein
MSLEKNQQQTSIRVIRRLKIKVIFFDKIIQETQILFRK